MDEIYDIGDAPTITAVFRNLAGTETDPTTVRVFHRAPDGTEVELNPTNPTVGTWEAVTGVLGQSGQHTVKFFGTGALVAAEQISFNVRRTDVAGA